MVSVNEFPIATANEIPGFKIIETKGFVYGLTVRSRGVGGQVSAGLRSLVGGEIKEYVSMMEDSRDEALERLIEHAKQFAHLHRSARFFQCFARCTFSNAFTQF